MVSGAWRDFRRDLSYSLESCIHYTILYYSTPELYFVLLNLPGFLLV